MEIHISFLFFFFFFEFWKGSPKSWFKSNHISGNKFHLYITKLFQVHSDKHLVIDVDMEIVHHKTECEDLAYAYGYC